MAPDSNSKPHEEIKSINRSNYVRKYKRKYIFYPFPLLTVLRELFAQNNKYKTEKEDPNASPPQSPRRIIAPG